MNKKKIILILIKLYIRSSIKNISYSVKKYKLFN
jgi:hypothetical protein